MGSRSALDRPKQAQRHAKTPNGVQHVANMGPTWAQHWVQERRQNRSKGSRNLVPKEFETRIAVRSIHHLLPIISHSRTIIIYAVSCSIDFGFMLGSFVGHVGVILGSYWGHVVVMFGSCSHHLEIILGGMMAPATLNMGAQGILLLISRATQDSVRPKMQHPT